MGEPVQAVFIADHPLSAKDVADINRAWADGTSPETIAERFDLKFVDELRPPVAEVRVR